MKKISLFIVLLCQLLHASSDVETQLQESMENPRRFYRYVSQNLSSIKENIEKGLIDPNLTNSKGESLLLLLMENLFEFQFLLEYKVNPLQQSIKGISPLWLALVYNFPLETHKVLFDRIFSILEPLPYSSKKDFHVLLNSYILKFGPHEDVVSFYRKQIDYDSPA